MSVGSPAVGGTATPSIAPPKSFEIIPHFLIWGVVVAYFFPLLSQFPSLVLPSQYPDALEFVWTAWRMDFVVAGSKKLYFTTDLYYPDGASLLLHTICEAIFLPLTLVTPNVSPVWRFNLAVIGCSLINGSSALSLFRASGANLISRFIFSCVLVLSPFLVGHLLAGHLNFIAIFPLLEIIRGLFRQSDSKEWRLTDNIRFLFSAALLPFLNLYYFYYGAMLVGLFDIGDVLLFHRKIVSAFLTRPVILFGLAVVMTSPHLFAVSSLARSGTYTPDHEPLKHSADVVSYLIPSTNRLIGNTGLAKVLREGVALHSGESSLYLGLSVIFLAIAALFLETGRKKRSTVLFLSIATIFLCLSFGPMITFSGFGLFPTGYDWILRSALPFYPSVPARFGIVTLVLMLCSASRAFSLLAANHRTGLLALLLFVLCVEELPASLKSYPLSSETAALDVVRVTSSITAVVDLPEISQVAMYRQTIHGKPLIGGFLSRRPKRLDKIWHKNSFVRYFKGQGSVSASDAVSGWCTLGGNALVVDSAKLEEISRVEKLSVFERIAGDPNEVVFVSKPEVCRS